jgi:hypothetical protein
MPEPMGLRHAGAQSETFSLSNGKWVFVTHCMTAAGYLPSTDQGGAIGRERQPFHNFYLLLIEVLK